MLSQKKTEMVSPTSVMDNLWNLQLSIKELLSCPMETTEIQQNTYISKYIDFRHLWVAAGAGLNI